MVAFWRTAAPRGFFATDSIRHQAALSEGIVITSRKVSPVSFDGWR